MGSPHILPKVHQIPSAYLIGPANRHMLLAIVYKLGHLTDLLLFLIIADLQL